VHLPPPQRYHRAVVEQTADARALPAAAQVQRRHRPHQRVETIG